MKNKKETKIILSHSAFLQNRRAELSTEQIVLIIILITSFAVILFFLFRLGIGEKSEEQICHNSVLQKASVFSEAPLQCYRNYLCITKDGSCEKLIKPEKIKVKTLNEVYGALANEMADCWWMFGEGRVDYVGSDLTKNNYCSICSQIYFDDSLKNLEGIEDKKISKDKLYDYLSENEYSKNKTYAEYLFGTSDIKKLKADILQYENNTENIGSFGNIEIGEQYFNVMGITSSVGWLEWSGVGAGAGAAVIGSVWVFSGPPGWIAGGLILLGGAIVGGTAGPGAGELIEPEIGAVIVEGKSGNQFMAPTLQKAESEKFKALNCEEILTYT